MGTRGKRPVMVDGLLLASEAARRLGIHHNTLNNWADRGIIHPALRMGPAGYRRYAPGEVERVKATMAASEYRRRHVARNSRAVKARRRYAADPKRREDHAWRNAARNNALRRLVAENRPRWQQLYYEELAAHGSKGDPASQA